MQQENSQEPVSPPETASPRSQEAPEKIHVRDELRDLVAGVMLSPEMSAASSMQGMMDECLVEAGIDLTTVSKMLGEQSAALEDGDLAQARRSLAAQAATLERMFHHLYRLATVAGKKSVDLHDRYLKLALRAQAQSMRTLQALGRLSPLPVRRARTETPPPPKAIPRPVAVTLAAKHPHGQASPVNPMPPGGWRGLARGGARWGGLSAAKR